MRRSLYALLFLLAVCLPAARPQHADPKAPALVKPLSTAGAQLVPLPELLYEHVQAPGLKPGHGVVVEQVAADSLADRAGLKRHDILLSYGGTSIRNGEHFLKLLRTAPDRKVPLLVLRGGQERRLEVSLVSATSLTSPPQEPPRGLIKPGGPPAVNVEALPLDDGKLRVTFTFYSQGKGKLDQVTCSGSFAEIQDEVRALSKGSRIPARVQDLIDVALKRLRTLNSQ